MSTSERMEVLISLEVPKITYDFPMINLEEATTEVMASQPNNAELQALAVPAHIGGECHVLLGIQYLAHFPRLVHSLKSGLGIYEVKLQPHSTAIYGPHHSFNILADKLVNTEVINYKRTNPPSSKIPLNNSGRN
jgi:hypothetical protein